MTVRFHISYTEAALQDLEALDDYLVATASHEIAERIVGEIARRVAALAEFPERGAVPNDLRDIGDDVTRQILVSRNRVLYQIVDDTVFIILFADGRRDMQTLLRQRLLTPLGSPR